MVRSWAAGGSAYPAPWVVRKVGDAMRDPFFQRHFFRWWKNVCLSSTRSIIIFEDLGFTDDWITKKGIIMLHRFVIERFLTRRALGDDRATQRAYRTTATSA